MLTGKQVNRAREFYSKHKDHINKLILSTEQSYPPIELEDKNSPAIWKAAHWRWFFENCK